MPVEIKELIIKAIAIENHQGAETPASVTMTDDDRNAIIDACVKQVLKVLKQAKER